MHYPTSQDSYSYSVLDNGFKLSGIYDGHGKYGHLVSRQVSIELPALIKDALQQGMDLLSIPEVFYSYALTLVNQKIFSKSGTTACLLIETPNTLYIYNTGDSTVVWESEDIALSASITRIRDDKYRLNKFANVSVVRGRINGGLNLSRSIGNFAYSSDEDLAQGNMVISPMPTVTVVDKKFLTKNFYLLVSDGITDVLNNQEIIDAANNGINQICYLAKQRHSSDDVTAVKIPVSENILLPIITPLEELEDTINNSESQRDSEIEGVSYGIPVNDWKNVERWGNVVFIPPAVLESSIEGIYLLPNELSSITEEDKSVKEVEGVDAFLDIGLPLVLIEKYFTSAVIPVPMEVIIPITDKGVIILNLGSELVVNDDLILRQGERSPLLEDAVVKFTQNRGNSFLVYHY